MTMSNFILYNSDLFEVEATKASFQMQLKLALAWNRIDVAKSEIFTSDLQDQKFEVLFCLCWIEPWYSF